MEGKNKKSTKPPLSLNIYIYNSKGHFVYFKDFKMKGIMPIITIQEELQYETNYLSIWIHIKT